MSKLRVGLTAILITCALMYAATAFTQTALDPTQSGAYPAYPAYLAVSCGGVRLSVLEESGNVAMVSATTNCNGSGRGAKVKHYLACWRVATASDGYYIVSRELALYATWLTGQAGAVCPGL